VAQTIARGRTGGLLASLGIHLGGYVHVLAAASGLVIMFAAEPILFSLLKVGGALYLVWLGIQFFLANPAEPADASATPSKSTKSAFWQSVTVEVLNPKTAIFFIAFLPQFADPNLVSPM
jgi:threonine/homoserine/homoserine lactone efflux protein